jgi:hypothetical protein
MAPSPSPVGLKLIPGYRVGKKIGSGAQLACTSSNQQQQLKQRMFRQLLCQPTPSNLSGSSKITKGTLEPEINERSIGKEFKLYNNHFPKLRDEGMLATMPFKGGIQPFGTKEGMSLGLSCIVTKAFSILPLVSHLSQNLFIFW